MILKRFMSVLKTFIPCFIAGIGLYVRFLTVSQVVYTNLFEQAKQYHSMEIKKNWLYSQMNLSPSTFFDLYQMYCRDFFLPTPSTYPIVANTEYYWCHLSYQQRLEQLGIVSVSPADALELSWCQQTPHSWTTDPMETALLSTKTGRMSSSFFNEHSVSWTSKCCLMSNRTLNENRLLEVCH